MHDEWDEVCHLMFRGRNDHGCNEGEFELKDGRRFASYTTKYGDGSYYDQYGHTYGVDAGLIGCIAVDDIRQETARMLDLGAVIEFKSDFYTSGGRDGLGRDWDGVIKIGHLEIETDPIEATEW
jgi:hypothetical protein